MELLYVNLVTKKNIMASQLNKKGENIGISWCDATVNLWWGCAKVHTGCKNCYAEHLSDTRYKKNLWGEKADRQRIKSAFKDLNKYQKKAKESGIKQRVFVGSMMDIFEDSKTLINPVDEFNTTEDLRQELFKRISNDQYENLIFLFLTKRPRNTYKMIPEDWSHGRHNVFIGTSVSDQETVKYADQLAQALPFNQKFLSIEPQVGNITEIDLEPFDWIIQGGESGSKKRPFNINWGYAMRDLCKNFGVPFFFKQIDKVQPIPQDLLIRELPSQFN